MEGLYPNLHERFRSEGLCPICLVEMELTPRYSCENGHAVCHRCKPYYYACPTCQSPLTLEVPPTTGPSYGPPPTHFMPHPYPPYPVESPSAPPSSDFLEHERSAWGMPMPMPEQELITCAYFDLGCWVRVPENLKILHESRCQFRPHLEEEHLPTDLDQSREELVECSFTPAGCRVRTALWRISIHENHCIYKDKFEAMNSISEGLGAVNIGDDDSDRGYGDPNELVECKYRKYGCMVNMPRRRKYIHQEKCNYSKYHREEDDEDEENEEQTSASEDDYDPDEQLPCRWCDYGCRVKPKRSRKEIHEEKCNYRMEECAFKDYGCDAVFQPARRFAHERSCEFAH